jgi:hypothetical protein
MALVRRMYEDSIIPVRDIARRAGVSERTLYKYARKRNWRPRYAWTPSGTRPHGKAARQRWTEARERAAACAPVKGAGGRFIRREDKDRPFAHGIAALDPAARAAAAAGCAIERAAEIARLRAEYDLARADHGRALSAFVKVLEDMRMFSAEIDAREPGPNDVLRQRFIDSRADAVRIWLENATALREETRTALARFEADAAAAIPVTPPAAPPS